MIVKCENCGKEMNRKFSKIGVFLCVSCRYRLGKNRPPSKDMQQRKEEMQRLRYEEGWTADKIGILYGISRERVFQVVGRGRVKNKNGASPRSARIILDNIIVSNALEEMTDLTTSQAAEELGVSNNVVMNNWNGLRHAIEPGSNMYRGMKIEEWVSKKLIENNIKNKLTNSRPVDIITSNGLKIEVKSRHKKSEGHKSKDFYYFPLERSLKNNPDFFILVVIEDLEKHPFVIPTKAVPEHGGVGFCWPERSYIKSEHHWQQYHNRFDLLNK